MEACQHVFSIHPHIESEWTSLDTCTYHIGTCPLHFALTACPIFFLLCFLHIWYRLCWCKTIAVFLLWQLHVILAATAAIACDFQLNNRSTRGDTSLERLIEDIWTWVVTGTPEALLFKCSFFTKGLPHGSCHTLPYTGKFKRNGTNYLGTNHQPNGN